MPVFTLQSNEQKTVKLVLELIVILPEQKVALNIAQKSDFSAACPL